jgi:hypothetical protein
MSMLAKAVSTSRADFRFSSARYGYLIGQLPVDSLGRPGSMPFPTTEENFEDRFYMCIEKGAFHFQRAVTTLRMRKGSRLRTMSFVDMVRHPYLLTTLVSLAEKFYKDKRILATTKFQKAALMNDATRDVDAKLQEAELFAEDYEKDAIQWNHVSLTTAHEEKVSQLTSEPELVKNLTQLRTDQLHPLHRLLIMCMDACSVTEPAFVVNAERVVWNVPTDCPFMALKIHLGGSLFSAVTQQMIELEKLIKVSVPEMSIQGQACEAAFQWVLEQRERSVFFVLMVEAAYYLSFSMSGMGNARPALINLMKTNHAQALCCLSFLLNPDFNFRQILAL